MSEYGKDNVFAPPEYLAGLICEYGTPLWVLDPKGLGQRYQALAQAFSWNQGHSQWLSMSKLRCGELRMLLAGLGCGVVCESGAQLRQARLAGFGSERIVFAPLCPSGEEMTLAANLGAEIWVDSTLVVDALVRSGYVPDTVGLRLWMGPGKNENAQPTLLGMQRSELLSQAARLAAMGVRRLGLVARGESGSPGAMELRVQRMLPLVEDIRALTGLGVTYLDVGCGGGMDLHRGRTPTAQAAALRRVLRAAPELALRTQFDDWLTAPAALLLVTVAGIKENGRTFVFLDAGPDCFDGTTERMGRLHVSKLGDSRVEGRISCFLALNRPGGSVRPDRRRVLPPLKQGDTLVFHDMGLYLTDQGTRVVYSDGADHGAQDPQYPGPGSSGNRQFQDGTDPGQQAGL